jgi:NADH-quinone oxidoreductase subunit J
MNVVIFYTFAAIILLFSLLAVTSRKILHAAVFLLFVLISTSGLYFLLEYYFLAAVQLTLYAGGIVVLIVFSILLTSGIDDRFPLVKPLKAAASGGLAILGIVLALAAVLRFPFAAASSNALVVDMKTIGRSLLSYDVNGYVLPFEAISILLLAAMIAAIVVAKKKGEKQS